MNNYDYYSNVEENVDETDRNSAKWNQKIAQAPKDNKISYASILDSLSMCIVNGRMQLISTNPEVVDDKGNWSVNPYTGNNVNSYFRSNIPQPRHSPLLNRNSIGQINEGLYYNAENGQYYNDNTNNIEQMAQLTPKEQKEIQLQNYIKYQLDKKRIAEIKSRKMMFYDKNGTSAPAAINNNQYQNAAHNIGISRPRSNMMKQFLFR